VKRILKSRRAWFAVAAAATVGIAAGVAAAVIGDGGVIYACYDAKDGKLRAVESSGACSAKEGTESWYTKAGSDATFGLGYFTGRARSLPALGVAGIAAAPSGLSDAIAISSLSGDNARTMLTPDRPVRFRDLVARLTTPSTFGRQIALSVGSATINGGVLSCTIGAGQSECSESGPSPEIPAKSTLYLFIGGSGAEPTGADLLFSWRATAG